MTINIGIKTNLSQATVSRWGLFLNRITPTRGSYVVGSEIAHITSHKDAILKVTPRGLKWVDGSEVFTIHSSSAYAACLSKAGIREIAIPKGANAGVIRQTLNALSDKWLWRSIRDLNKKSIKLDITALPQPIDRAFPKDKEFYYNYLLRTRYFRDIRALANTLKKENKKKNLPFDELAFYAAAGFMAYAHSGVNRDSGDPYSIHPSEVSKLLYKFAHHIDGATHMAAFLHDTVEDVPGVTLDLIREIFGGEVAFLVDGMTKLEKAKKEENMDKFVEYIKKDIRLLLLKLVDRGHNLATIEYVPVESQIKNAIETLEFYVPLAWSAGFAKASRHLADISLKTLKDNVKHLTRSEHEQYKEMAEKYQQTLDLISESMQSLSNKLNTLIENVANSFLKTKHMPNVPAQMRSSLISIRSKPRTAYELMQIATMRGTSEHRLSDIVMLQITVPTIQDCFLAKYAIGSCGTPLDSYYHDYINDPKINGYQSLHGAIEYQGQIIRFQIRTPEMQLTAQQGVLANAYSLCRYLPPRLPWFNSAYLDEMLRGDLTAREKIILLKSISAALMTSVMVEEPQVCTTREAILPPGISASDIAFITNPEIGMRLLGAAIKDTPIKENDLTKPITRRIGSIRLILSRTIRYADHLATLNDPVAKKNYIDYLQHMPDHERLDYARNIFVWALAEKAISIKNLIEQGRPLFPNGQSDVDRIIDTIGSGRMSAKEAVQTILLLDATQSKHVKRAKEIDFEVENIDSVSLLENIIEPLKGLLKTLETVDIKQYDNGNGYVRLRVPYSTDLQEAQIRNFIQNRYQKFKGAKQNRITAEPRIKELDKIYDPPVFWLDGLIPGSGSYNMQSARAVEAALRETTTNPVLAIGLIPDNASEELQEHVDLAKTSVRLLRNAKLIILSAPKKALIRIASRFQPALKKHNIMLLLVDNAALEASDRQLVFSLQRVVRVVAGEKNRQINLISAPIIVADFMDYLSALDNNAPGSLRPN